MIEAKFRKLVTEAKFRKLESLAIEAKFRKLESLVIEANNQVSATSADQVTRQAQNFPEEEDVVLSLGFSHNNNG